MCTLVAEALDSQLVEMVVLGSASGIELLLLADIKLLSVTFWQILWLPWQSLPSHLPLGRC